MIMEPLQPATGVADGSPMTAEDLNGTVITIAVPTYRRPQQLQALLDIVLTQIEQCDLTCRIGVIVVDNDPELSAAGIVAARSNPRVRYVHEPRPGVVAVRNRALREAWQDDVLIFIDDDQLPAPEWLSNMIASWTAGADAVSGPVVSVLPADADSWIRQGGFFDRRYRNVLRTGDRIDEVATTNLLLDMSAVRARDLIFDERFGLSGGEDSLFTRTLTNTGGSIVWAADARVIERVPADRAARSWVCRRAISSGNGAARVRIVLARSCTTRARTRVALLASGAARCAAGGAGIAVGVLRRSIGQQGRSTRTMMRGLGICLGAAGISYLEYARDGRRWHFVGVQEVRLSRPRPSAADRN